MITASFLSKHLLIDWRWGEAYFAERLLDFDLASNNGGWQWAAGSGCDAAPYFRIFNPTLQQKKFDPDGTYIKKWLPDLEELNYPEPIVEHSFARERAIRVYKESLEVWKSWKYGSIGIISYFHTSSLSYFHTVINIHQYFNSMPSFFSQRKTELIHIQVNMLAHHGFLHFL